MPELVTIKRNFEIISRSELQGLDGWERLVTGVVADPENVDSYGNKISAEEIRSACYGFMERFQNMGIQHKRDSAGNPILFNDQIVIVGCDVIRQSETIEGTYVPKGAWVMTCRIVDDEIWEGVLDGTYTGYSFEAFAKRVPVAEAA